jgi:hypothetical protein
MLTLAPKVSLCLESSHVKSGVEPPHSKNVGAPTFKVVSEGLDSLTFIANPPT